MSDLSHPHCRKCRQPNYACECDEPDEVDSVVNIVCAGKDPPEDHPFFDHRPNLFKKNDPPS